MHIILLEYGPTVINIGSGPGSDPNLRSVTLTQCVNSGTAELTIGSVCAACVEATIYDSKMRIREGLVFNLIEVDDAGSATKIGRFKIKTANNTGRHIYKITAYDAVVELDKNLALWLSRFDFSQNCTLLQFAKAVCEECGLSFVTTACPNDDFIVGIPIADKNATGRKILRWCAEIACRYCRATVDGDICFDWYKVGAGSHTLMPSGDYYYCGGSLSYGEYECLPIDAVVIERSDGVLWPEYWWPEEMAYTNPLIIRENMLLIHCTDDAHRQYTLMAVKHELDKLLVYRSCKVSCPASRSISIGDVIDVTDTNDIRFHSLVMNKVKIGRKITLECYGSHKRQN